MARSSGVSQRVSPTWKRAWWTRKRVVTGIFSLHGRPLARRLGVRRQDLGGPPPRRAAQPHALLLRRSFRGAPPAGRPRAPSAFPPPHGQAHGGAVGASGGGAGGRAAPILRGRDGNDSGRSQDIARPRAGRGRGPSARK